MTILDKIIEYKKSELEEKKKIKPLKELIKNCSPKNPGDFIKCFNTNKMNFICEVKKASPSKGIIRENFSPTEIAQIYENNGAQAISVLTDKNFFMGTLEYLAEIKKVVKTPLLRKDFIIDEYQIYEALEAGASAVLLIAAALKKDRLKYLYQKAKSIGLDVLLEIHNKKDLRKALLTGAEIIGINNRNLKTFKTNIKITKKLIKKIPDDKIVISESGINTKEDVKKVFDAGARGVLIGEALCREEDIGKKLKELQID